MSAPNAIIIGAGPSGIALAYKLKHTLGFQDFTVYEKLGGVGGTWLANSYPGCGCDVPTHLYSFSFNLNPNWSKELCDQAEILEYMNSTVDKFGLRPHIHTRVECAGAEWDNDRARWNVKLIDLETRITFIRHATIFVSAVGGISFPRDIKFKGMENFKGKMFHTARWDHSVNYAGKRIAVIGNGCSAAQVIPPLARKAAFVKQYARSAQWYHDRPNRHFTSFEKWAFKYVPLWMRFLRLRIFLENDASTSTYTADPKGVAHRKKVEAQATKYIHSKAPEKYHKMLVPTFQLGCKRRIFDPEYLDILNQPNMELVTDGIAEITENGIIGSKSLKEDQFDLIVLATGFQVTQFLTPMEVIGKQGISLNQQWKECRGAQAYFGTYVHNFPNFAIIFGPNTFPANNSVIFSCEVQVDYALKTLFIPIIDRKTDTVEVKQTAEDYETNKIHHQLRNSVFAGACSNWYIGAYGRNVASWPETAANFWFKTMFPKWSAFRWQGGEKTWVLNTVTRTLRNNATSLCLLLAIGAYLGASTTMDFTSDLRRWTSGLAKVFWS